MSFVPPQTTAPWPVPVVELVLPSLDEAKKLVASFGEISEATGAALTNVFLTGVKMPEPQLPTSAELQDAMVEPMGFMFENAVVCRANRFAADRQAAQLTLERMQKQTKSSVASSVASSPLPQAAQRSRGDTKKTVKLEDDDLEVDWYHMLRLTNGEDSTDEEIILAHKKRCLETHPDKQADKSDKEFKKVQRALDILMNPDARRVYDSSKPFDDAIPPATSTIDEKQFYMVFGDCFKRNQRFSLSMPVPQLGDDKTPIADVKKFYDFWLSFRSWRDFSHAAELEKIHESMARDEKRYYQRENARIVDKLKRDESKRVRTLVDRALKIDPRLRRHREEEERAREAAKAEKAAVREAAAVEARRVKEAAIAARESETRAAEAAAIAQKNAHRDAVKAIIDLLREEGLLDRTPTNALLFDVVRGPNTKWFSQKSTKEEALALREALASASQDVVPIANIKAPTLEEMQAVTASYADFTSEENFVAALVAIRTDDIAINAVPLVMAFNEAIVKVESRLGVDRYGVVKPRVAAPPVLPKAKHADPSN